MITLQKIALVFTIIGALNWGLVGIFDFNLVAAIFGAMDTSIITRIIYALVGIAGIINIGFLIQDVEFK